MNNNVGSGNSKNKKMLNFIKATIIVIVIMILLVFALMGYMYYKRAQAFKVVIDGKEISELSSGDIFKVNGGEVKVQLKGIAKYLGNYNFRNGQYGRLSQYTEDKTSCYLQNDNEVVTFSQGLNTIEKVNLSEDVLTNTNRNNSNDLKYDEYKIDSQVEMINNNLYTTLNGISIGCNVYAEYDSSTNTVTIYTLAELANIYTNKIPNAVITGDRASFSNQKAILYDLIVVVDENGNYGVLSSDGKTVIIGEKYKSIKFIESTKEFIVKTAENKMGIISIINKESKTKITPTYDSIEEINEELYLVSNNNKYGVINKNNQVIVSAEYDKIGIDMEKVSKYNLKNGYVIYDDIIPVKKNNLWGFASKSSKSLIVNPEFTNIGCIVGTSSENSTRNSILIPEYEAFVVEKDNLYGVINSKGSILIPIKTERIEERTESNKTEYYFTYSGEHNLVEYLTSVGIPPVTKVEKEENKNENTISANNVTTNTIEGNVENVENVEKQPVANTENN